MRRILDPGFNLTLRPMAYPKLYEYYKTAIKNTWTVDEVDFSSDVMDLKLKMDDKDRFMVERLVAFFATGDSIVSNNLVLNLYRAINSPEARMYLSRQLYEEALHVEFYLTLLDTYLPDPAARAKAFAAVDNIPVIKKKADFCFKWIERGLQADLSSVHGRRDFLMTLVCFAACIEGLFFFSAFAYVYYLRSRNLLNGLASGTNWVFRDESMHMNFAFEVVRIARSEEAGLWDSNFENRVRAMLNEAAAIEKEFAQEILSLNFPGFSYAHMCEAIDATRDQRLIDLGVRVPKPVKNPLTFMGLQDMQELTNFFERRVSAYQVGVTGDVNFDEEF